MAKQHITRTQELKRQIFYHSQDFCELERLHSDALRELRYAQREAEWLHEQTIAEQAERVREAYSKLVELQVDRERQYQEKIYPYQQGFWAKFRLFIKFYVGGNMVIAQTNAEVRDTRTKRHTPSEEERKHFNRWQFESQLLDNLQHRALPPETPRVCLAGVRLVKP